MTADELKRLKDKNGRQWLTYDECAALIAEVERLQTELAIAQEDLLTERRNNGQFGVGA